MCDANIVRTADVTLLERRAGSIRVLLQRGRYKHKSMQIKLPALHVRLKDPFAGTIFYRGAHVAARRRVSRFPR